MSEIKKQTAVEWLVSGFKEWCDAFPSHGNDIPEHIIQKAKQMDKEQHKETFKQSRQAKIFEKGMPPVWENFEQYYNETYGKE
jgi:hypothetical protein